MATNNKAQYLREDLYNFIDSARQRHSQGAEENVAPTKGGNNSLEQLYDVIDSARQKAAAEDTAMPSPSNLSDEWWESGGNGKPTYKSTEVTQTPAYTGTFADMQPGELSTAFGIARRKEQQDAAEEEAAYQRTVGARQTREVLSGKPVETWGRPDFEYITEDAARGAAAAAQPSASYNDFAEAMPNLKRDADDIVGEKSIRAQITPHVDSRGNRTYTLPNGKTIYSDALLDKYVRDYYRQVNHSTLMRDPQYRKDYIRRTYGKTEEEYIQSVLPEFNKRLDNIENDLRAARIEAASSVSDTGDVPTDYYRKRVATDEFDNLYRIINRLRKGINSADKNNFWSGLSEGFDLENIVSLGLAGVSEGAEQLRALKKYAAGEQLSPAEKLYVDTAMLSQDLSEFRNTYRNGDFSSNNVGNIVSNMVPFAVQMAVTGNVLPTIGKRVVEKATAKVVARTMKESVGKGLGLAMQKIGLGALNDAVAVPFMGMTYQGYVDRRRQQYSFDEDGVLNFIPTSRGADLWKAYAQQFAEVHSERVGDWISSGLLTSGSRLAQTKWLNKIYGGTLGRLEGYRLPPVLAKMRKDMRISGFIGENLSEAYGDVIMPVLTGEGNLDDLKTRKYWLELCASTAIMSGSFYSMSIPSAISYGRKINQYQKETQTILGKISDDTLRERLQTAFAKRTLDEGLNSLAELDWKNISITDAAYTSDYIFRKINEQLLRGEQVENKRLETFAPLVSNAISHLYQGVDSTNPDLTTKLVAAQTRDGQTLYITFGDPTNDDSVLICTTEEGEKLVLPRSAMADIQEVDLSEFLATQYAMMFGASVSGERLTDLVEQLKEARKMGVTDSALKQMITDAGYTLYDVGDEVTLSDGEAARVDMVSGAGRYVVRRADGEIAEVGFMEVMQPDPATAQAQVETVLAANADPAGEQDQATDEDEQYTVGNIIHTKDGRTGVIVGRTPREIIVQFDETSPSEYMLPRDIASVEPYDTPSAPTGSADTSTPTAPTVAPTVPTAPIAPIRPIGPSAPPAPTGATSAAADAVPDTTQHNIPQDKDGNIDFDSIDDPALFAELLPSQFDSIDEAIEFLEKLISDAVADIESLSKKTSAKRANKALAAEKQIRAQKARIKVYQQAADILRQKIAAERTAAKESAKSTTNKIGGNIAERWNSAPKAIGVEDTITTPSGKVLHGRWIVVPFSALTPSHDPHTLRPSEGFPTTAAGTTVNDNDYSNKRDAIVRIAQDYDARALDNPIIVSGGIVISGNNRTMSGQLAAEQGTNTKYMEALPGKAAQRGIDAGSLAGISSPALVFEVTDAISYDTATFAEFNKTVSKQKNPLEMAIALGKSIDKQTTDRLARIIEPFDTMGEFHANTPAVSGFFGELIAAGVITDMDRRAFIDDNGHITEAGKEFVESLLLGTVFDEDVLRQLNQDGMRAFRAKLTKCILLLQENKSLAASDAAEDYSCLDDFNDAIRYLYAYRSGGYESLAEWLQQLSIFESNEKFVIFTVAIADALTGKLSDIKTLLTNYNTEARSAKSGQIDMFSSGVKTKEDIQNEITASRPSAAGEAARRHNEYIERTYQAADSGGVDELQTASQRTGTSGNGAQPTADGGRGGASDTGGGFRNLGRASQAAPAEVTPTLGERIESAEAATDVAPTEAQKAAGNYKKGHVQVGTFNVTIENPKGSVRRGVDASGKAWQTTMHNTYGYIRGTEGVDGDHIDVFLSDDIDGWNGRRVFVIDQYNEDGTFDEHKVMLGFNREEDAVAAYLSNYEPSWSDKHKTVCTSVIIDEFEKWIESSHRKTKPFAEYKTVNKTVHLESIETGTNDNLDEDKAIHLVSQMKEVAETARELELTVDNWEAEFGEHGTVKTPIGKVKMGENQYRKLLKKERASSFGLIKPTLTSPDIILEESDPKEGAERETKYLFVKTFLKPDGSRYVHFESVTVQKNNLEVSISSHEIDEKALIKKVYQDKLIHLNEKFSSSDVRLTEPQNEGSDLVPAPNSSSAGKGTTNIPNNQATATDSSQTLMSSEGAADDRVLVANAIGKTFVRQGKTAEGKPYNETLTLISESDGIVEAEVNTVGYGGHYRMSVAEAAEGLRNGRWTESQSTDTKGTSAQGYTIERRYHKKNGAYIQAVKFTEQMPREQFLELKKRVKDFGGYYSSFGKGGFIFDNETNAHRFAKAVLDPSGESLDDAVPVTLAETRSVSDAAPVPKQIDVIGQKEDTATPTQPETNPSGNRLVTDERYEELKRRMRAKFGQLNVGIDPEILAIGTEMAVYHIEKGARKFAAYAKAMIADLGDAVRPYLKSFYNGARDLPEVIDSGMANDMTSYDDVRAFDIANFDKSSSDPLATTEMVSAEQEKQAQMTAAKQQIINQRNSKRRKENEQTTADTLALAEEAEVVGDKAERDVEAAADERGINRTVGQIDETLDKINDQLALLGYYEFDKDDSKFSEEYGYMLTAEKKAVKDAADLARRLVEDLGIEIDRVTSSTTLGRKRSNKGATVSANIAPAGGAITIRLPLKEGRELAIYINLNPVAARDSLTRGDNLAVESIMYRIENPSASGDEKYGINRWVVRPQEATYAYLLQLMRGEARKFLPEYRQQTESAQRKTEENRRDKRQSRKKSVSSSQTMGSLFGDVLSEDSTQDKTDADSAEASFRVGDKVLYKGEPATIFDIDEDGALTLDMGLAPVLYEVAAPQDVKRIDDENGRTDQGLLPGYRLQRERNRSTGTGREDRRGVLPPQSRDAGRAVHVEHGGVDGDLQGRRNDGRGDSGVQGGAVEVQRDLRPRLHDTVTEAKNTRNNHSERGVNHAPTSVDARIDANIKAIELARRLIDSGDKATPAQMSVLRKFSGWGGLGKAFNDAATVRKLQELLGTDGFEQAIMSANSAYYTPAYVIDALWDIAERMGFEGGNILEGSAGIGNILGQMPTRISDRSDIHAIEIDATSGGILSLLYPDAKVDIQGFEKTRIPNGGVDLAITNVPFVTGLRVDDSSGDKDLSRKFHNIHDFCIAKNIRKLREGGIGIFISSNGTLDNSKKLRDWVVGEGGADFVGAFRLHNKTFGGTSVTSDIIIVKKRVNGKKSPYAIDVSAVIGERTAEYDTGETRKVKGREIPVIKSLAMDYNRYFIEHPENMAGSMRFAFEEDVTFRPTSKGLYPVKGKDQDKMLADFVESFADRDWVEETSDNTSTGEDSNYVRASSDGKKLGEMYVKDGKLVIASPGGYYVPDINTNKVKGHTKAECFEAYAAIKKALADVLAYQLGHDSDKGLKPLLDKLNKAYDSFVAMYGHFNKNTAIAFLRKDVDYVNVSSVETFKEVGNGKGGAKQIFGKADVMNGRVIEKEKELVPTNVKDGIVVSIFKFGRIDVQYIAEQLGESVEDVKRDIIENGYGFEDPITRQIEVSYQYLSGNVREKLRQAQENNVNGIYDTNIKELQRILPMDIPAHLIDFTLGSSWVDPKLYEEYVLERTGIPVRFTPVAGTWVMSAPDYGWDKEKNRSMGVVSEKLHKTIMGHTLIEAAIQNRSITVSQSVRKYDGSTETITDVEATQACAAKMDEIRQDFKDWARQKMQSDADMSARMERIYNDTFNNYVPLAIPDEAVPEYFGGASHKFKMRPHQGKAIVRGTMQPLLLAHEVGSGKTYTIISTAMEMRRLGTARKPMIVVQNATVGQFVASAKELYPNAKILTLEEADRSAEGRKNFYAKIRYNDWDMIIIPQSTFERIPDSEERQAAFIQDRIEEKMLVLEQMKEADAHGQSMVTRQAQREIEQLQGQLAELTEATAKKRGGANQKKRAVALQNAEVRAQEMLDRETDDVENFDDMGIDALLVDEAHEYKHLGFATAMQRGVKGVDPSYSKKSQGMYLKVKAVLEKNNGRNVIFATGTPISNTAAEIWTFMRYLMPADTMKEYGIYYFDDFVRNFGNIQQMLEFTTSGKFRENNRFAGYVNLPELVRIWSSVADTVRFEEIEEDRKKQGLPDLRPQIENGKAQDIYLPQTRALRSIMKYVKAQLEKYDKMSGKEKKENSYIPLTMYGIAKAAAVDARLVQAEAEDDPNSKTNEAVRQTLRSLQETEGYKGTVAIFADNYQNKQSGFNLYEDIKAKLIAAGVPSEQIVVMKSGMDIGKKVEIFDKVNRGEVRVILGSTFTLGTGVNIQERLHTLIHLDAPNRPMDYTQRNGRIWRQGNIHKQMNIPVRILRFGVEDSLDVTAYQRLKTKGAIADSIMNGKATMSDSMRNRVLEEEEDAFGDTVAQLSGSEYAMLKNNAEKNVRKYESRKKQWQADQIYIRNAKPKIQGLIARLEQTAKNQRTYLNAVKQAFPNGTFSKITVGKRTFSSVAEMTDFIKEYNKSISDEVNKMKGDNSAEQTRTLSISLGGYNFTVQTVLSREMARTGGQLFSEVHRKMTYSCPELGLTDVPVHQSLLRNAIEDIVNNVITGKDFEEMIEAAENGAQHNKSELAQLLSREGKPFEYEKELEHAKTQLQEYTEAMRQEMAEKEAKYAEMDANVEAASDISVDEDEDVMLREGDTMYRIRESAPPKKTGVGYKVFVLKNGELYPPMVANPNGVATPVGVWLDADAAPIAGQSKTGRNQVKAGGKGTQGGSGRLAYRPGWHLGEIPYALQFNRADEDGNRELFPANFVWAEVEYADDIDYQEEAMNYGINANGKFQHALAGLPKVPVNGSYRYRTNPNPETDPWIITGAMKVKRLLTPTEVDELVEKAGREPQRRQHGAVTDAEINDLNKQYRRADNMAQSHKDMAEHVTALAEKLHLDNVEVVTDVSGLQGKKARAKGFYTKSAGKITIVIPNNSSVADAEITLLHEAVAHYGLRQLFGERFDTFLDNVFTNADAAVRSRIEALAEKYGGNVRMATEEYLAGLAEQMEFENAQSSSWWQKIKDFFLDMLDKIGFSDFGGAALSDNELRYILWRSYENLRNGGVTNAFTTVADTVKQNELGVGEYAPESGADKGQVLFREAKNSLRRERKAIERAAKANGTWLKAPNGKATNLKPDQWITVRTESFKNWFGDWENDPDNASKVVDENGEPRVVYHGTIRSWFRKFNAFKTDIFAWFTPAKKYARQYADYDYRKSGSITTKRYFYEVFLNIRNYVDVGDTGWGEGSTTDILEILAAQSGIDEKIIRETFPKDSVFGVWMYQNVHSKEFSDLVKRLGYDGVKAEEYGNPTYAVLYPSQIKSATENYGTFDDASADIRYRTEADRADGLSQEQGDLSDYRDERVEAINNLAGQFGVGVEVVTNIDDIPSKHRDAKGYYNVDTGKVVIILPNNADTADVQATYLHEVVAHHGLRELLGDKFDSFLDGVWSSLNEAERHHYKRAFETDNDRIAAEELCASLAEGNVTPSLLDRIVGAVRKFFRDILGLPLEISKKDIIYTLYLSKNNLSAARTSIAKAEVIMAQKRMKDALDAMFGGELRARRNKNARLQFDENGHVIDINESQKRTKKEAFADAKKQLDEAVNKAVTDTIEMVQDSMVRVKQFQDKLRDMKVVIDAKTNYYDWANTTSSRAATLTKKFEAKFVKPMIEVMNSIINITGLTPEALQTYLLAESSLERHASGVGALDDRRSKDGTWLGEWNPAVVSHIVAHTREMLLTKRTAILKKEGISALSQAEQDILAESTLEHFRDKGFDGLSSAERMEVAESLLNVMWQRIMALNRQTLSYLVQSGIRTQETVDRMLSHNWKYYVPLVDFAADTYADPMEAVEAAFPDNSRHIGVKLNQAEGRKTKAKDPVSYMIQLAERVIFNAEENKTRQVLLNLMRRTEKALGKEESEKLWQLRRIYLVKKDGIWVETDQEPSAEDVESAKKLQREIYQEKREIKRLAAELKRKGVSLGWGTGALDKQDAELLRLYDDHRKRLASLFKAEELRWQDGPNFAGEHVLKADATKDSRSVEVYENGIKHNIIFHDPKIALAINQDYGKIVEAINTAVGSLGNISRYLAAINTAWNPAFVIVNALRDFQHAAIIHALDAENGQFKGFMRNYFNHFGTLERGMQGKGNPLSQKELMGYDIFKADDRKKLKDLYGKARVNDTLFDYFQDAGGITGFNALRRLDEIEKQVKLDLLRQEGKWSRMLKNTKNKRLGNVKQALANTPEWVAAQSEVVENMARFATFLANIDAGKGLEESVKAAKNITVNFNRKGKLSALGQLYVFFNASIQGTAQIAKVAWANKKRFANFLAAYAIMGFADYYLMALLFGWDDDDDETPRPPYYIFHDNAILAFGKNKYYKLPLPQGLRTFWSWGVTAARAVLGEIKPYEIPGEMSGKIAEETIVGYQDNAGLSRALIPTMFQPIFWDIPKNMDAFGRQIHPEDKYGKGIPDSQLGAKNVNPILYYLTSGINAALGGNAARPAGVRDDGSVNRLLNLGDINPSNIEHLISQYTGGVGQTILQAYKTAASLVDSDLDFEIRNVPILNRFVGQQYETKPQSQYYTDKEYINRSINTFKAEIEHGIKHADNPAYIEMMRRKKVFDSIDKEAKRLYKYMRQTPEDTNTWYELSEKRNSYLKLWNRLSSNVDWSADNWQAQVSNIMNAYMGSADIETDAEEYDED